MADMKIFGGLIAAFIVLVIGLSFLSTTGDTISGTTDTYTISDETFSLINGTPVAIVGSTYSLASVVSVVQGANTLTVDTHYTVSTGDGGTVNLTGVTYGDGSYNVTYTYQTGDYVADSGSRAMISLIMVMFAIAVLMAAVGYVNWKDFGL